MIDVVCIDSSIHAVKNGGLRDKKRRSRVDSDSQQAVADRMYGQNTVAIALWPTEWD